MGPRFSCWLKGIARWDSRLFEIARRDLAFHYYGGRQMGPHTSCLFKRNRQMGFQVVEIARRDLVFHYFGGRQMGPRTSCLLIGIARWDSKLSKGDRQKRSHISIFVKGGR